mmetsp:Transcript_4896/g.17488  ORF Transcript_4896/g.17488 Transcript_4896/m.17488 type:complete len:123 (-) Transcript_4896:200-568(-)
MLSRVQLYTFTYSRFSFFSIVKSPNTYRAGNVLCVKNTFFSRAADEIEYGEAQTQQKSESRSRRRRLTGECEYAPECDSRRNCTEKTCHARMPAFRSVALFSPDTEIKSRRNQLLFSLSYWR